MKRVLTGVLALLLAVTACNDPTGGFALALTKRVDAGAALDARITDQDKGMGQARRSLGAGLDLVIIGQRIKADFVAFVQREFNAKDPGMESMLRFEFEGTGDLDASAEIDAGN